MLLHNYLAYFAREKPDHVFAEMNGALLSYFQSNQRANQFAQSLSASGLKKGDRFAYISKNSIDMAVMYFGASKAGIMPVPLNYRLAPRELLYIISDADSKVVFCQTEFIPGIDTVKSELNQVSSFVQLDGTSQVDGWNLFESWLGDDATEPDVVVSEFDQIYQMYTSGTTGLPKGAMLSHHAVCSNIEMARQFMEMSIADDRNLIVAPMYHAAAAVTAMTVVSMCSTLVIHSEFNATAVVDSLSSEKITMTTMVPSMIQACLVEVPDLGDREFPALRQITYGASPISLDTLQTAMEKFGCGFGQAFGMTELSCIATSMNPETHERALAGEPGLLLSAGRAVLGTEIKIVDENDNEVANGTVGEILVRGPQVMMGYWNLPEETEKALKGGWMHTGDAAYMDDEGFIYIQDRIKDMIVSGAENIYPAEVESALFEHAAVADAAVIGIPSEQWGETVLAFLVLKHGESLSVEEMIEFCRERLAGFKIPRQIEFLNEIPRNASGKVLKKNLREPYWQKTERRVS